MLASSSGAAVAVGALAAAELKRVDTDLTQASREHEGGTGLPGAVQPWV